MMEANKKLKKVNWKMIIPIIVAAIIITQLDFIPHDVMMILTIIISIAVVMYFIYSVVKQKRWDALIIASIGALSFYKNQ
jgi:uncharacterized membrane protein YfcA